MQVKKWERLVLELACPAREAEFCGIFKRGAREVRIDGFYGGEATYKLAFMPDAEGTWTWETESREPALNGITGEFSCEGVLGRGPVSAAGTGFIYANGERYLPIGTTCYAWNHQEASLRDKTLATLARSPFNKLRMCVFPKFYEYNSANPAMQPMLDGEPNPEYFAILEDCVARLDKMGVEADLILFHPYDKWGYADMTPEADRKYLKYMVSRFASFKNVWWSFANEFDLMNKPMSEWDDFFRLVAERDPYSHPRSIHNCRVLYDHSKPLVTHASIQHNEISRVSEWIRCYKKPVIIDECGYEGDIHNPWGSLTAREMAHRIWLGFAQGGAVGHGETYWNEREILWWSKGGELIGDSASRIAFLKEILGEMRGALAGFEDARDHLRGVRDVDGKILFYVGERQPRCARLGLAGKYRAEVIDAWRMTRASATSIYEGECEIPLPGQPMCAILLTPVKE